MTVEMQLGPGYTHMDIKVPLQHVGKGRTLARTQCGV